MPRQASKCREWEKDRRDRLNNSFTELSKKLPCYQPSLNISKIEILQKAASYIDELDTQVKDLLANNAPKATCEKIKKLRDQIKKLLIRNEQLCNLLKDAGIRYPSECGLVKFKTPKKWAGKISPNQAKVLAEKEAQKENNDRNEKIKEKKTENKLKKKKNSLRSVQKARVKRKEHKKLAQSAFRLNIAQSNLSLSLVSTQSCFIITNAPKVCHVGDGTKTTTVLTDSRLISTPLVATGIKAPTGTVFVANNNILPFINHQSALIPNQTILTATNPPLIVNQSLPRPENIVPTILTNTPIIVSTSIGQNSNNNNNSKVEITQKIPISTSKLVNNVSSVVNLPKINGKTLPVLRPKAQTRTTQANKVPIPALSADYKKCLLRSVSAGCKNEVNFGKNCLGRKKKIVIKENIVLTNSKGGDKLNLVGTVIKNDDKNDKLDDKVEEGRNKNQESEVNETEPKEKKVKLENFDNENKKISYSIDKLCNVLPENVKGRIIVSSKLDENDKEIESKIDEIKIENKNGSKNESKIDPKIDLKNQKDPKNDFKVDSKNECAKNNSKRDFKIDSVHESTKNDSNNKTSNKEIKSNFNTFDQVTTENTEKPPDLLSKTFQKSVDPLEKPSEMIQKSLNLLEKPSETIQKPLEEPIKDVDFNSELSNDIFASLSHDVTSVGGQNPESTSPTAAFLLAFPLVSSLNSLKVAEVIEDEAQESQRETPTLLQIGTMDNTKTTRSQSDTLTPSLLNLDNFSFFPKEFYQQNFDIVPSTTGICNNNGLGTSKNDGNVTKSDMNNMGVNNGDKVSFKKNVGFENKVETISNPISSVSTSITSISSNIPSMSSNTTSIKSEKSSKNIANQSTTSTISYNSINDDFSCNNSFFCNISNDMVSVNEKQKRKLEKKSCFYPNSTSNYQIGYIPSVSRTSSTIASMLSVTTSSILSIQSISSTMSTISSTLSSIFSTTCTTSSSSSLISSIPSRISSVPSTISSTSATISTTPLTISSISSIPSSIPTISSLSSIPSTISSINSKICSIPSTVTSIPSTISSITLISSSISSVSSSISTIASTISLKSSSLSSYSLPIVTTSTISQYNTFNPFTDLPIKDFPMKSSSSTYVAQKSYNDMLSGGGNNGSGGKCCYGYGDNLNVNNVKVSSTNGKNSDNKNYYGFNYDSYECSKDFGKSYDKSSYEKVYEKSYEKPYENKNLQYNQSYYNNSNTQNNQQQQQIKEKGHQKINSNPSNVSKPPVNWMTTSINDRNQQPQQDFVTFSKGEIDFQSSSVYTPTFSTVTQTNYFNNSLYSNTNPLYNNTNSLYNNTNPLYNNTNSLYNNTNSLYNNANSLHANSSLYNNNNSYATNDFPSGFPNSFQRPSEDGGERFSSWSPSKLPHSLDPPPHGFMSGGLPTLVGDLALGTTQTIFPEQQKVFSEQQKEKSRTSKDGKRNKLQTGFESNQNNNFLSVSQLVDHSKNCNNNGNSDGRMSNRRNSGSGGSNNKSNKGVKGTKRNNNKVDGGNKIPREAKNDFNQSNNNSNTRNIKNPSSNYSAEALLSHNNDLNRQRNQQSYNPIVNKSLPVPFLAENLLPYFPPVDLQQDNNLLPQNQSYHHQSTSTFGHNFTATIQNNVYSNNGFVGTTNFNLPDMTGSVNDYSSGIVDNNFGHVGSRDSHLGTKDSHLGAKESYLGSKDNFLGSKDTFLGPKENYLGSKEGHLGSKENYLGPKDNFLGSKETFLGSKESYSASKETYSLPKETYASSKESYGGTKEIFHVSKESFGDSKEPFGVSKETYGVSKEPFGILKEPFSVSKDTYGKEPFTVSKPPYLTSKDSHLISKEPYPVSKTTERFNKPKSNDLRQDEKSSNINCSLNQPPLNKKSKKSTKVVESTLPQPGLVDFTFLPMPTAINSPILPDDFHSHTNFLPPPPTPTQLYPCKNPLYGKSADLSHNLLPITVTRPPAVPHPEISPSLNSVGNSLTNFNLSTIFPEINKVQIFKDF